MSTAAITNYLKACYPVLWVKTFEEERAITELQKIGKEQSLGMKVWSVTNGFFDPTVNSDSNESEMDDGNNAFDAVSALEYIKKDEEKFVMYVLQNFHFYMEDNAMVIQTIKDLIPICKKNGKHIVFLSGKLVLPIEVEKEITVVDFDLPDLQQLDSTLQNILDAVGKEIDINDRQRVLESALGLTCAEAENAFALAVTIHRKFDDNAIKTIQQEKANIIKKTGMLEFIAPSNTINDIGGASEFKKWAETRKKAFSKEAKLFGVQSPKGAVLLGVSGGGKSAAARALANLWQLPILRFNIGKVFGSLVGESEENMSRALKMAEAISPCILWIDEMEKALAGLGASGSTDSGVTSRVFGELLTWMQEKTKDVFVLATANNVSNLPPELLRKGRFDEIFWFDLPEMAERKEILSIHLKKRNRNPENYNLDLIAQETIGFVGAELEQVVVDGISIAFADDHELNTDDLLEAAESTVPLSKTREVEIKSMRSWAKEHARSASVPIKRKRRFETHASESPTTSIGRTRLAKA